MRTMSLSIQETKRFEQVELSKDYVVKRFAILQKNYPDLYIGLVDQQVRYSDKDLDTLLGKIVSERGSAEGVFVAFVPSKEPSIVV